LLTGRPPFTGDIGDVMRAHVSEPPPSLRAIDPRLPAELDEIVRELLAKDPARRPATADDVVGALGDLGGGVLMPAVSTPLVPIHQPGRRRKTAQTTLSGASGIRTRPDLRTRRRRARQAWIALAAVVSIVGAGVFGVWLGKRNANEPHPARLAAARPAPPSAPAPIPDAQIESLALEPAKRHELPRPRIAIAPKPCLKKAARRRAGSAALRGRSPC